MRRLFWILCCLFFSLLTAPLHAQIAFVQAPTACVSNLGATSLTCTFAQPVAAGDMLIASAMPLLTPGASAFTATVSDTVNGGWVHGAQCYSAYNAQADFFYFPNTAAGSDTVTVNYSSAAELYLSIAEYSGVNTSTPFDAVPTCTGYISPGGPYQGPSLTTTTATDMLISTLDVGNAGVTTVSSPYTERVANGVTIADDLPGTAGTQTGPTWSVQYGQDGFVIGAALKAAGGGPATLTVGPSGQYASPCAAFPHLASGDTLQVDANGGTPYDDTADCLETAPNVTITGIHGRPIIDGSKASIAKAMWVIDGYNVTIDNFEFRNANSSTSSSNAEAIRIEPGTTASPNGGNVTVERSYIHDNFEGILSDSITSGAAWYSATPYITFQYDEFANNGYGDGLTHNMYIGCCGNMDFTLQYSWSHDAYVGHTVKDRAPISNILSNLIGDSTGNTSYLLDFPLGGSVYVVGNSLYKLATTNSSANTAAMIFADVNDNGAGDPEYGPANQDLHFINNTMVLDPANQNGSGSAPPAFVSLGCLDASYSDCTSPPNGPALTVPAVVENNIFLGAETAATNQSSALVENNLLESNASASNLAALKFNNAAGFDFRLTAGSPAIQAGVYPPTNNAGTADPKALATYQYVNPVDKAAWPTPSGSTMDAGAFPFETITPPSLNLTYTQTVQVPNTGTITVTGLPTPSSGQYNYASFVSGNQAAIPPIESVASSTGTVTTTFSTASVAASTVVPINIYVDGTVLTANVTVTPATLPAASIAVVSGSGQTAAVGTNFANPLVVIVKDAGSNPVSGVTVTFAGTGVSFPSGATAVTNSSGQAQITAQPAATGALTITASVAGVTTPASFSETGTTGAAATIAVVSGSGQTAAVGTNFPNPLVVIVKDVGSNPVSGVTVTFAGTGVSFPSGATAVTNSSGQAQITAQPAATGALTITASVAGVTTPASFSETGTAAAAATIAVVSGSGQTAAVGTNFPNPLVVIVKDASNNPVSGVTVTFAGTGVSFPSGATAVTNSSGQAQITAQPTATGALTITASVAGVTTPASFSETGTEVPSFTLAASPTTLSISRGQFGTVVLSVTPVNGFNQSVSFSCSGLPINSTCSFSPSSVTPNGATASDATMTIATTQTTARNDSTPPPSSKNSRWPVTGGGITLALSMFFFGKKKRLPMLVCLVLLLGIGGMAIGCGAGSPYANVGSNTVIVTATSGSGASAITQTVTVSVTIQ